MRPVNIRASSLQNQYNEKIEKEVHVLATSAESDWHRGCTRVCFFEQSRLCELINVTKAEKKVTDIFQRLMQNKNLRLFLAQVQSCVAHVYPDLVMNYEHSAFYPR
jgi:hypothetical protein